MHVSNIAVKRKKLIAFGWYGGKYSHLDWLLPLLPKAHHYCEPFGGSAAVLLNREVASVETYNDMDGEVGNFFKVLRDQKEDLLYAIGMTPFSREEFQIAIASNGKGIKLTDLERARQFFVRARQVRTGHSPDSVERKMGKLPVYKSCWHGRRCFEMARQRSRSGNY